MREKGIALGLVLGLAAATAAVAQSNGALRWRQGSSALGLQPAASTPHVHCGPFALACDASATLPVYSSGVSPRSVSVQVGYVSDGAALTLPRADGLSVAVVGTANLFSDFGVYGRVGTVVGRGNALAGLAGVDRGMTYGVGLSWDLSERASALVGFESYEVRGQVGEVRDVRSTNLGLRWRY